MFYAMLRRLARAALSTFYSRVDITGLSGVDRSLPTIYAPTHPNSIVDPLLLAFLEKRQVRFVARHGLFRIPIFGSVLRAVGSIPVYRRSDANGPASDNRDMFAACRSALKRGGVLVIFPEGKTHGRWRVESVKTGVARIALDFAAKGEKIQICPIGLNYLVRHVFRSDVHIGVGEPIVIDGGASDEPEAVRRLTAEVGQSLRSLSVHIEREEDERLITQAIAIVADVRRREGLDAQGQSPGERVALAQRVIDAYRWLHQRDPFRWERLRRHLLELIEEGDDLGFRCPPALQKRKETRSFHRLWDRRRRWILFLGAPLALFGVATHGLPYLLTRAIATLAVGAYYRRALAKLLVGALLFTAQYAALGWIAAHFLGATLAGFAVATLPPSGLFARRYLSELRLHRFSVGHFYRAIRYRGRLATFRRERELFSDELARVRQEYLAHLASVGGDAGQLP